MPSFKARNSATASKDSATCCGLLQRGLRAIAASPLGELDEIGELLARRRFVLTGDLALAD